MQIEELSKRIQLVGDCWLWMGQMRDGWPALNYRSVRRYLIQHRCGPLTGERTVYTTCDNERCVNPDHLYPQGEFPNIDELYKWAEPCPASGCVLWMGSTKNGYGRCIYYGKDTLTHRLAWVLAHGSIADDAQVHHLCNTRLCIAIHHLTLGTHAQNMQYMIACERSLRGEENPDARLTDVDVRQIRKLAGTMSQRKIAALFGVTKTSIYNILKRKTWRHID